MGTQQVDKHFPRRVRERLDALGMGVAELARLLGYQTHTPVSQALAEKNPRPVSWDKAAEYARHLGCSLDWLARGQGVAPPAPAAPGMVIRTYGTDSPPEPKTLGERVRLVRAQSNMNSADWARFVSGRGVQVSRQALYKIENDEVEDPSCRIMVAIEEATGYRVRWLLTGRGDPKEGAIAALNQKALVRALEALQDAQGVPEVAAMPVEARAAMLAGFYKRLT